MCYGWCFFPDLGPGQWEAEAFSDGPHQHGARRGGQLPQPLPVLLRRGQAGQVLGPGVQQGTMSGTTPCIVVQCYSELSCGHFYCINFQYLASGIY